MGMFCKKAGLKTFSCVASISPHRDSPMARPSLPHVDPSHCFVVPHMPAINLATDLSLDFRCYALGCEGDAIYVGVAPVAELKARIQKHWNLLATHFTTKHPPLELLGIWCAATRAAEAFLYFSFLGHFPHKLIGGWVQTSSNPSPLILLQQREARSNMLGRCFTCSSSSHFAVDCPKKKDERLCWYPCSAHVPTPSICCERIYLNSRGGTPFTASPAARADAVEGAPVDLGAAAAVADDLQQAALPQQPQPQQAAGVVPEAAPVQAAVQQPAAEVAPEAGPALPQQPQPQQAADVVPEAAPAQPVPQQPAAHVAPEAGPAQQAPAQQPTPSFEHCWSVARVKNRSHNLEQVRSMSDILRAMNTGAAKRALNQIPERVAAKSRKLDLGWRAPRDYQTGIAEMGSRTPEGGKGGGKGGVGVVRSVAEVLYREYNKP